MLGHDAGSKICAECLAALSALPHESVYPQTYVMRGAVTAALREPAADFSH